MSVEQRRSALIESAYRVIADHGVEGATTRRICAHAGMPLASFHYAFESRTSLLCAVMETAVPGDVTLMLESIMLAADQTHESGTETMRVNMRRQLRAFLKLLKADPGRMQATISLGLYAHNHPELQRYGKSMYEQLYRLAASGLEVAAQRSGVRWREPVDELGPIVIAATNAITLVYLATSDDKVVNRIIDTSVNELMASVAADD